mgnify:CR=1 FL=1|jgi:hypothetical protein
MILEKYVKNYLIENLKIDDISIIDSVIERLNDAGKVLLDDLYSQGDEKYYHHYAFEVFDNVAYSNSPKLEELGKGAFRRVYSIPGEEWALKLSYNTEAAKINKEEVNISQGKHGLAARDIFIKVYDYDKLTEYPCWIICQKVFPMEDIADLNILKKVFPTFWNMIKEGDIHKTAGHHFISMISSALTMFGYYLSKNNRETKKAFFQAVEDLCETYDFNDIVFYDDFKRISSAYNYISTTDMHEGNFGLVSLINPSPESFVIIDFDVDSHV